MSLKVYNSKRNFRSTPEPKNQSPGVRRKKLIFVVQKHDATRLHYDFRLEMNGVLKSWAIPKGPSMVAGEKRLAVMVEDHPLPYGKFYGEIPEGNYGAGIVEILDRGTYMPATVKGDSAEKNLIEMHRKGDIKFILNGTYLKGRFALFRLNSLNGKDNEWMLVKKADEYADSEFDIGSLSPLKTSHKLKRQKTSKRNPIEPFPDPLPEPMLAKLSANVPDHPSWIYEVKLDGYRIIGSVHDGHITLISRNGKIYTTIFKELTDDLARIEDNLIIDGEVVVENKMHRSDFRLLQEFIKSGTGILKYYVFDILYLNGHSIMKFPLQKRKELLDSFFIKYHFTSVFKLEYQTGNGKELFGRLSGDGFEGIIAKDPESTYVAGDRSDAWIKVKTFRPQEAIICGYTQPQGSNKYFGSLILGIYEGESLKYIGNCGSGFNDTTLRKFFSIFNKITAKSCPFRSAPQLSWTKGKPVWLKPELVASIKFQEWTRDKKLRHPVFLGLREDKTTSQAAIELNMKPGAKKTKSSFPPDGTDTSVISGKKLKLTNLTKVYWEDSGYTKGDLISYYEKISKYILPYLKERPQSLNRYPGGINGQNFYQKNIDASLTPKWIKTVNMSSKSHKGGIDYLICNDLATLIYMANLGCIEINPWHSTYLKPEYPTYIIIDLDPGDIGFEEVVNTALVIRELCDMIEVPCYPKTSGASGMHIYIPLGGMYDYEQARTFSELLAVLAHNRLLSTTSIERAVYKRKDKVYIDFLQNRKGQTIAAPYSVRPRPLATVSTPLNWKEVNSRLGPEMFTIKNMEKRLERVGDIWQPVLKQRISLARALKAIEKLS